VVRHDARADREAVSALIASWWFPETDAGVVVQVVVTLLIAIALGVLVREERSLVLLVIGVTLVTLGWYGIRGLH
jgi:hypothetical protein